MRKRIAAFLLLMLMLPSMGLAQGMVSISELHAQAEALGGRWQGTYETKKGAVTIDAPIIVPDVDAMPVITVEGAKISKELYDQIVQGERDKSYGKDGIAYETEIGGETALFRLGREENGLTGYEAVDTLNVGHGVYREGLLKYAAPTTYHHAWDFDTQKPSLRDRDMTLEMAMNLWHKDIELCFPGESFEIQPTEIIARGSILTDATGKQKEYKYDAFFKIMGEQVIGGVPLFGSIVDQYGGTAYGNYDAPEVIEIGYDAADKQRKKYGAAIASVTREGLRMESRFATEEDYYTEIALVRMRSVENADVPLASLDTVLAGLVEQVEKGKIGAVNSVRLGYILYSNPDMTDHAWAIPRWVIEYAKPEDVGKDLGMDAWNLAPEYPWVYYKDVLVDAQSGDVILFGVGDETTLSVPKLTTWDDVN